MSRRTVILFVFILILITAGRALAVVSAYQIKQIETELNHPDARIDERYFDGKEINGDVPFPEFNDYFKRFLKRYQNAVNYWNRLSRKDHDDPKMAGVKKQLYDAMMWQKAIAKVYPQALAEYQGAAKQKQAQAKVAARQNAATKKAIDDKCRLFKKEVMTVKRMYSMMGLLGRAGQLSGGSPGSLEEMRDRAETVARACALPKFADVGVGGCQWLKIPPGRAQWNPEEWCAVAPKWREILRPRVDAAITEELATWNNRPLLANTLKGEQSMTFFARAVPNDEGWRDIHSWQDLYFNADWRKKYLAKYQKMYDDLGLDEKVPESLLAPIDNAFADLRKDAEQKGGQWQMPKDAGRDYSVDLARQQYANFLAKGQFIKAWLGRNSWRVHKNALGVPLRRTKPGFIYYSVNGQKLCQITSYTLTEPHMGGGKYGTATEVTWGYSRFQSCP